MDLRLHLNLETLATVGSSVAFTMAIGAIIYFAWDALHRWADRYTARFDAFGLWGVYERSLVWIPRTAAACARSLQHGRLPGYTMLVAGAAAAAIAAALLAGRANLALPGWQAPGLAMLGACAVVAAGALFACFVRNRLVLLLVAGFAGYGSAVVFLYAGAPDVAFTQFTVETAFVVVAAAVLLAMRRQGRDRALPEGLRTGPLLLAGMLSAVLVLALMVAVALPFDDAISRYFAEASVPDAHGRNVVNVVLVDFRALDTLGEMSVVLMSLLAALPLLGAVRSRRGIKREGEQ